MFLALNVFSAPELDIVTAERLEASFYQPMTDDQQECDDTSVGPSEVKIKISYSYVQNLEQGFCKGLTPSEKEIVDGAVLYAGDSSSRPSFIRTTFGQNTSLLNCFEERLAKAEEFREISESVSSGDSKTINTLIRKNSINRWTPQLLNMGFKSVNKDTLVLNVDFLNKGKRVIGFIPVAGMDSKNMNLSTGALLIWASLEGEDFIIAGQAAKLKVKTSDVSVEFSGFLGAHFTDSSSENNFGDLSSVDESFSLLRGDRLDLGALSFSGPIAALKAKLHANLTKSITSDLETRFQILNNDRGTYYRNDFRGRLVFSPAKDIKFFIKQREIDGASMQGDEIQRNSVTAGGIIITPVKEKSSGGYGSFSFSGMRENIKERSALLGELKLGARSQAGSRLGLLVRGGMSENGDGNYDPYGSLLGRLSFPLIDRLSIGLDGRVQTGRTPMQFRDGMLADNEPYPFSRPFWFTGVSLMIE